MNNTCRLHATLHEAWHGTVRTCISLSLDNPAIKGCTGIALITPLYHHYYTTIRPLLQHYSATVSPLLHHCRNTVPPWTLCITLPPLLLHCCNTVHHFTTTLLQLLHNCNTTVATLSPL